MSSNRKSFFERFVELRRALTLVAWRSFIPLGLGRMQVMLLLTLLEEMPLRQSCLSQKTATDLSATGRALRSLESRGWVRRKRSQHDKREVEFSLTPVGEKVARQADLIYKQVAVEIAVPLNAQDLADFERIADKLITYHRKTTCSPK